MGKGDKKTAKGKRFRGSAGKTRQKPTTKFIAKQATEKKATETKPKAKPAAKKTTKKATTTKAAEKTK